MLTVKQIDALKFGDCPERIADGNGLYLRTSRSGHKSFQARTSFNGKMRWVTLGSYPTMNLKQARMQCAIVRGGNDENHLMPFHHGKACEAKRENPLPDKIPTLRTVAIDWFEIKKIGLSNGKHIAQNWSTLETYVFPTLGDIPISEIRRKDIIATFRPIWRLKHETARRTLGRLKEVMELACTLEIIEHNPAIFSAKVAFGQVQNTVKHHEALDWKRAPEFYEWLVEHDCDEDLRQMILAMLFSAKRTKEVRFVAWQDLDLSLGIWCSRAEHMKMRRKHRIPVSRQLDSVFRNMALFNNVPKEIVHEFRSQDFVSVFARPSNKSGVMDENRACREIQIFEQDITGHGLRSAFRTWARKQNCYAHDVMEYALAHEKNSIVAAYFREDLLEERRQMMQDWADYLTGGNDVAALKMVRA